MSKHVQRGFTLIEVIIFIVVASAGMAGILSISNTVVKSSADPMVRKQAVALADAILEEILQKEYSDPDGVQGGETTRATMDDVSDYDAKTQTLFNSTSPGGWPAALDGYKAVSYTHLDVYKRQGHTMRLEQRLPSETGPVRFKGVLIQKML